MKKLKFDLDEMPLEIRRHIANAKKRKIPWGWMLQAVDRENKYAIFVKAGKPWYLSKCPNYEGYWLLGGLGSVQCKNADQLIPGLFWDEFCRGKCQKCPYYTERKENDE